MLQDDGILVSAARNHQSVQQGVARSSGSVTDGSRCLLPGRLWVLLPSDCPAVVNVWLAGMMMHSCRVTAGGGRGAGVGEGGQGRAAGVHGYCVLIRKGGRFCCATVCPLVGSGIGRANYGSQQSLLPCSCLEVAHASNIAWLNVSARLPQAKAACTVCSEGSLHACAEQHIILGERAATVIHFCLLCSHHTRWGLVHA